MPMGAIYFRMEKSNDTSANAGSADSAFSVLSGNSLLKLQRTKRLEHSYTETQGLHKNPQPHFSLDPNMQFEPKAQRTESLQHHLLLKWDEHHIKMTREQFCTINLVQHLYPWMAVTLRVTRGTSKHIMGLKYGMHFLPFGALKAKGGKAMERRIVTFPDIG